MTGGGGGRRVSVLHRVVHRRARGGGHSGSLAWLYRGCATPGQGNTWTGCRWPGQVRGCEGMGGTELNISLGGCWRKNILVLGLVGCGVAWNMNLVVVQVTLGPG